AVLDITIRPDGVWIYSSREQDGPRGELAESQVSMWQWLSLLSGSLEGEGWIAGNQIINRQSLPDGSTLRSIINRDTLTVRQHQVIAPDGRQRFALLLDRYRTVGQAAWPQHIEARSAAGRIIIDVRTMELNEAIESAFQPP